MSDAASQPTSTSDHHQADGHEGGHDSHAMKLWPFFLALLGLTAAEVGLYETWSKSAEVLADGTTTYFIPKFALIWLILVFTLPKAYIVFVYFMHLRFEKAIVVALAVIPLLIVFICVLPTLTDTTTLKEQKINPVTTMKQDSLNSHGGHDDDHDGEHKGNAQDKKSDPEKTN